MNVSTHAVGLNSFTINGGDTYCVNFGGAAGGQVTNLPTTSDPDKVFKILNKRVQGFQYIPVDLLNLHSVWLA